MNRSFTIIGQYLCRCSLGWYRWFWRWRSNCESSGFGCRKINNLDENKITYNYRTSIHEEDHDLYITVTHNGLKGEGAFDF